VYRHLRGRGAECVVVAPSLIPRRPGDRIKTDRRDATALARLHRAGELTPVWVPDPEHEAMRDLVRARAEDMAEAPRKARQRLNGFLLRHGRNYDAKRWTSGLGLVHPPRAAAPPQARPDPLLQLRGVGLDPAEDGGVVHVHAAVGEHQL
jgi:transposase